MWYLVAFLIVLIIAIVIVIFNKKLIKSLSMVKSKIQGRVAKEILSKDLDRDILIELVKYERFLYKAGFTRRVIIEISEHIAEQRREYYKFYYYNLLNGIHCFVMYNPYSKFRKFYYHFETRFQSNKSAISAIYEKYIASNIPENIYFFKHPKNMSIENLYNAHKKDRDIKEETIHKGRLEIDLLLKADIYKTDISITKRKKPNISKKRDYNILNRVKSIKIPNSIKIDKKESKSKKIDIKRERDLKDIFNTNSLNSNAVFIAIATFIVLLVASIFYKVLTTQTSIDSKSEVITTLNTKDELKSFNSYIAKHSGLSIDNNSSAFEDLSTLFEFIEGNKSSKKISFDDNLLYLDRYFSKSKIDREIGLPIKRRSIKSNICKLPKDLDKLLSWHNGVGEFVPNGDLLSWNKIETGIKSGDKFVYLVLNRGLNSGLAFSCSKNGLFKSNAKNSNLSQKEFYNIEHFINVVSQAYKKGAFYENKNSLKIDLVKYFKIYRDTLSYRDKKRYNELIEYLKEKAKLYKKYGSKELRVRLIQVMKQLYEPKLDSSIKLFINDKNLEVKREAILALKR